MRLCDYNRERPQIVVSIHALTKSATPAVLKDPIYSSTVSIHALTKSATLIHVSLYRWIRCFNPRTHEECDLHFRWPEVFLHCFNPRTHEECDCGPQNYFQTQTKFQSTHSRRVRRSEFPHYLLPFVRFNPRTHEECDVTAARYERVDAEFQSTHSRRVRLSQIQLVWTT